jgi:hypothetical protein
MVVTHGPGRRKDRWSAAGSRQTRASTTRGWGDSETPRCVRALGKTRSLGRRDLWRRPWGLERWGRRGLARARQARRGAGDVAARALAFLHQTMLTTPIWLSITQKFSTQVHYAMNRKVVDLTTLYNFHKGSIVFFSTDFAQSAAKLRMSLCFGEREVLPVDQVFHPFPLKIWNAILHESCVPQQAGQLS